MWVGSCPEGSTRAPGVPRAVARSQTNAGSAVTADVASFPVASEWGAIAFNEIDSAATAPVARKHHIKPHARRANERVKPIFDTPESDKLSGRYGRPTRTCPKLRLERQLRATCSGREYPWLQSDPGAGNA